MQLKSNVVRLGETVRGVETMTRFALAVLALASGVYTYLGVRSLLDGSATFVFFAAIIYSAAVSVAIYAFWSFMLRFVPLVVDAMQRVALFLVMAIGCAMIVAMSSWLNAAALAGSAALEQHLAVTLEGYVGDVDAAHANALLAQSLLPDVQRASDRFTRLADDERASGALTGTSGSGSVVQLLSQMSAQMNELGTSISGSRAEVAALFETASGHLGRMREVVSAPGPVEPRADQFAAEVVQLNAVISAMQETGVAPSVKRAAQDLSLGFIAPVADGANASLMLRQDQVMQTVRDSVAAQSAALSQAADEILAEPRVEPRRFVPLSTAEAVLRYWSDFLPSWAGAISIDLLPVVLVLVLMVVNDAMRREANGVDESDTVSAREMLRALRLYQDMTGQKPGDAHLGAIAASAQPARPVDAAMAVAEPDAAHAPAAPPAPLLHQSPASPQAAAPQAPPAAHAAVEASEAVVTPIDVNQRKRSDGPVRS